MAEFDRNRVVFDQGAARIYRQGTFIYRLAGRDREKSASYYTPEPLARLLVKHLLMERCKDLEADELLELKILEPAMGSAAFLIETTNQLADLYLERKQTEAGRILRQEDVIREKQKVRAYIADRNCFGVDLNPIASELAAISLWLNGLHDSDFSPWFGDQLHAGNSLIGVRRASYGPEVLTAKTKKDRWIQQLPNEVGCRSSLPDGHVWQWLLPAEGMVPFDSDKSIKALAGEAQDAIKQWRKGGFFAKLEAHELELLQKLSRVAEDLFDLVALDLARIRKATNDAITLWPDREMPGNRRLGFRDKDRLNRRIVGIDNIGQSLPFSRLKTVMDAWCALWMWPLDKVELLPTRAKFLHGISLILEGGFEPDGTMSTISHDELVDENPGLFCDDDPQTHKPGCTTPEAHEPREMFRETNVVTLVADIPWLKVTREVASRERFVHFDLIFADVMRDRGGFDLIVGNPPWIKPEWNEQHALVGIDPLHDGLSATAAREILTEAIDKWKCRSDYLKSYVSARGAMAVTSSAVMNPFIGGGANNLASCFVDLSFRLIAPVGNIGLIHQDSHLGEPKSASFRRNWYSRIAKHFSFLNELTARNFSEIHSRIRFSLNIYRGSSDDITFEQFTDAVLAAQIEESYRHHGEGLVPGIKTKDGKWNSTGHRKRILEMDNEALQVIRNLSETSDTPVEETRFIAPFTNSSIEIFDKLCRFPKLGEAVEHWQMSRIWDETNAQKGGTIRRETAFRKPNDTILQGPHFHVANPFYKTPCTSCLSNADYDVICHLLMSSDYCPRTNYIPAIDRCNYRKHMSCCNWDVSKNHTENYRLAIRSMTNPNNERTLISALIIPELAHVNTVQSVAFNNEMNLLNFATVSSSLPYDFITKASGILIFQQSIIARLPWVDAGPTAKHRLLRLSCLTNAYTELWDRHARTLTALPWSSADPRLDLCGPVEGPSDWDYSAALRSEFARRQALVEIDVLVAQALGLELEHLLEIYRIYFPVMQMYEAGTWYDSTGQIVWTASKGLKGVGYIDPSGKKPGRAAWEKMLKDKPSSLTCTVVDDTHPGGPREVTRHFEAPFTLCDREEDYRRAWSHFEKYGEGR